MKPDISEFSYGYAFTEALILDTGLPIAGVPIFPSLIKEGQSGGYDVSIPFQGLLLFLQFKLSHFMTRRATAETKQGLLDIPFYRMHLRPARHSRQHAMLLDLENNGEIVFYVAPKFHLHSDLNSAYLNRTLLQQSLLIRPSTIGALPDDLEHHISFRDGYPVYLCSEPMKIRELEKSETALKELLEIIKYKGYKKYDDAVLNKIIDQMLSIIQEPQTLVQYSENIQKTIEMKPIERIRYLSRNYFDCETVVVKTRTVEE